MHSGPSSCWRETFLLSRRWTEYLASISGGTTISAIAEKAGVQRHTYYAHFPEVRDLYQACMGHYLALNPLPDPASWAEVADDDRAVELMVGMVRYLMRT